MICPNPKCRKENSEYSIFCEYCGKKLDAPVEDDIEQLKAEYANLKKKYNSLLESDVFVRVTKIYNEKDKSTSLDHKTITYLNFDYTVSKAENINYTDKIFIKLINPDGSLEKINSSPSGYTWLKTVSSGTWGWGSDIPSVYSTGYYTIEFWYNDNCVGGKNSL